MLKRLMDALDATLRQALGESRAGAVSLATRNRLRRQAHQLLNFLALADTTKLNAERVAKAEKMITVANRLAAGLTAAAGPAVPAVAPAPMPVVVHHEHKRAPDLAPYRLMVLPPRKSKGGQWLNLPIDLWLTIFKMVPHQAHQSFLLTGASSRALLERVLAVAHSSVAMSMERARAQIVGRLEMEREAERVYTVTPNRINQSMLNATRAWRGPGRAPFPYIEFQEVYLVFRADTRAPGEIFMTGFQRLTESLPNFSMSHEVGGIAYHMVSTSKRAEDALEFAVIRGRDPQTMVEVMAKANPNRPPKQTMWIYMCAGTAGFYLHAPSGVLRNRHEVALIGVPSDHILAGIEIDVQQRRATGRSVLNTFQQTPAALRNVVQRVVIEVVQRLSEARIDI